MSTRGDLFIKDKEGSVNRYLIRHDAFAEYFQKVLREALDVPDQMFEHGELSIIERINIVSPNFLELENDDLYGGLNIVLNMADDSIEIKNSDTDAYGYHSKDIYKFNGKISEFLELDLEKTMLEKKSTESYDNAKAIKFMPIEYNFPQEWASYIINDDSSGIEDDDLQRCNSWLAKHKEELGDGHWSINYEDGEDYIEPQFMKFHDAAEVGVLAADCITFTWNKKIELDKNIADAIESKSVDELDKRLSLLTNFIELEKLLDKSERLEEYENEKAFIGVTIIDKIEKEKYEEAQRIISYEENRLNEILEGSNLDGLSVNIYETDDTLRGLPMYEAQIIDSEGELYEDYITGRYCSIFSVITEIESMVYDAAEYDISNATTPATQSDTILLPITDESIMPKNLSNLEKTMAFNESVEMDLSQVSIKDVADIIDDIKKKVEADSKQTAKPSQEREEAVDITRVL